MKQNYYFVVDFWSTILVYIVTFAPSSQLLNSLSLFSLPSRGTFSILSLNYCSQDVNLNVTLASVSH